jgi:SAM-dependent methyltransferase
MLSARTRSRAPAAAALLDPRARALAPAGFLARRARELADPLARAAHRAAERRAGRVAPRTLPPRRLRARTGAPGIREFVEGGRRAADELDAALLTAGLPGLAAHRRVLDFGCGSARVLPHVCARLPEQPARVPGPPALPGGEARCTGCDVDPAAIAWAAANHPGLSFAHTGDAPPLPFPDRSFDLVYSISVFSHLDRSTQDGWLAELRRVLAPGGVALLSVHGRHAYEQFRSGAVRTGWCDPDAFRRPALAPGELVFVPYTRTLWNEGELPGVGADYGLTFHGEDYLRRHWGETLQVIAIVPRALAGWQDAVVCRRPELDH